MVHNIFAPRIKPLPAFLEQGEE